MKVSRRFLVGSSIKIKHANGITIIHTDVPTRIVCRSGSIDYIEKPWAEFSPRLITERGYKQTYIFRGK